MRRSTRRGTRPTAPIVRRDELGRAVPAPPAEELAAQKPSGTGYTADAFEQLSRRPVISLSDGKEATDVSRIITFSDRRLETSAVSARKEPTKYILISVIARVMHCWNRRRYTSASLK